jgi:drug/metabolite transporter (DMT)-like permease
VPSAWGLVGGERLHPAGYAGLGLALVAVVLVGFVREKGAVRPSPRGIGMAVGSGAMIGAFMIIIDQTPDSSGVVPLVLNRAVNATIMLTVIGFLAARTRRHARAVGRTPPRVHHWLPGLPFALACGVLDTAANVLMLAGIRLGGVTITSVLIALYPAGTIILAAAVLRERIAPVQWAGLALAVTAGALLALP